MERERGLHYAIGIFTCTYGTGYTAQWEISIGFAVN